MNSYNQKHAILIFIFIVIFVLFFAGCKNGGEIPPFPTKYIYEFAKGEKVCIRYEIIKNDPLTVDEGQILLEKDCPMGIMGFDYDDAAKVFSWVRKVQAAAKDKCK